MMLELFMQEPQKLLPNAFLRRKVEEQDLRTNGGHRCHVRRRDVRAGCHSRRSGRG
jgi:hypothetical protein